MWDGGGGIVYYVKIYLFFSAADHQVETILLFCAPSIMGGEAVIVYMNVCCKITCSVIGSALVRVVEDGCSYCGFGTLALSTSLSPSLSWSGLHDNTSATTVNVWFS